MHVGVVFGALCMFSKVEAMQGGSMEGYLMKQDSSLRRWKPWYFRLEDGSLSCYETKALVGTNKKSMELTAQSVAKYTNERNCFGVQSEEAVWFLLAKNEESVKRWMTAINAQIHGPFTLVRAPGTTEDVMLGGAAWPKILLCLSGSVAGVKAPKLAVMLSEFADVRILVTESSKHFLDRSEAYDCEAYAAFSALDPPISVLSDADEWGAWNSVGDPVLHIQLRDWADMLLVAPLSANTLAKLAGGLCDDLVTCVARAWDFRGGKSFVVAPAMNTHMWEHPLTDRHMSTLKELGVVVVPPASKRLACGDKGVGALAEVEDICERARLLLGVFPPGLPQSPTEGLS